jgi:uncharacterized protein YegP (UPF0339 family)
MIDIIVDEKNSYKFTLKAESGTVLLKSVDFGNENKVKQIIQNLSAIQQRRSVFERKTNHKGEFLFYLKNLTGEIIGTSGSFSSEAGMENGIQNLKKRIAYLSNHNQL